MRMDQSFCPARELQFPAQDPRQGDWEDRIMLSDLPNFMSSLS